MSEFFVSNCDGAVARFHHFGLAVKSFPSALRFYSNLGYTCGEPVIDNLQNVELLLCSSENHPTVELIKPINVNSPIVNYLSKCNEMIYHLCYEVDNFDEIERLFKNSKSICVSKPTKAILFEGRFVSFYYISNVGLIEVLINDLSSNIRN